MKKILAVVLTLMMVLSLAACGGKTDPAPSGSSGQEQTNAPDPGTSQATDPGASQNGENNNDGKIDTSTVSGFFSSYGLTEADVKPDGVGEGEIEANQYIESQATVTYKASLDLEKATAWCELFMSATKAASDDGKIYGDITSGKEFPGLDWQDTAMKSCVAGWMYRYNGAVVIVTIDTTYEGSDAYFAIVLEKV